MSDDGTTPIRITVQTATGARRVRAHAVTAVPGLCVHQAIVPRRWPFIRGWTVTHVNTGLAVHHGRWASKEIALSLATALGKLGDWAFAIPAGSSINTRQLREVLEDHQREYRGKYQRSP